jgi:hypothetical protein
MAPRLALLFLYGVLLCSISAAAFSTGSLTQMSKKSGKVPTRLLVSTNDEQDWLAEMESKSYDYLKEHKEPLFDHEDWAEYRSPNRRLDDTFDFLFPGLVAFIIYFVWAAIQM